MSQYKRPKVFVAWHPDDRIRMSSASGGAFSLMAESVISRGGVVFGAAWNADCKVEMIWVDTIAGIAKLRESKYVAAIPGQEYKKAKEFLDAGREVLFSGTPCQIAGFYAFLKNSEYPNLITVDFICHGTPDRRVWDKYVAYLEEKFDDTLDDVHFRDKRWGVESNLLLKVALHRRGVRKIISGKDNTYYCGFNRRLIVRKACLSCRFNMIPRRADLSLCDFRGLGEHVPLAYEEDKVKGFTGVLINNEHAENFLKKLDLRTWEERPFNELADTQSALTGVDGKPEKYDAFWKDFEQLEWESLARRYLVPSRRYSIYILVRRILGPRLFLRAGIIYKKLRGIRTTTWTVGKKK